MVGSKPPARVVINEFTTIASVWTHAQFIDGMTIKGAPLQLRIAAGNVPNFVDLETGGYGATIADALNSTQSPTLANFGTLANALAGCVTRVKADACSSLFEAARPPSGGLPTDTLNTTESIALYPWHQPDKVFALLAKFYPIPPGKRELRPAPFMPYLTFAPSAWVLPLRFAGGGYYAGGKLMIDSQGNIWTADNFQVGAQAQDTYWAGGISKFAPNGTPLSPREGFTCGGQLGQLQGTIATPSGDIWAADSVKLQLVYLPKGDASKGKIFCQNPSSDPLKNPCQLLIPFALAIDQKDNIWVTNIKNESSNFIRFRCGHH